MSLASESKFLIEKFIQKPFYLKSLSPVAPFRIFKPSLAQKQLSKSKFCLPLNRLIDPLFLCSSSSHISLWSESHMQFAKLMKRSNPQNMDKLILKNPYKTEKLIQECLQLGLKTMVVDSFEQLSKIHQCRVLYKTSGSQYPPVNFVWNMSDPDNDLKQVETLKSYNIKLGGLYFDEFQTTKLSEVKKILEKVNHGLCQMKKVKKIFLTQSGNFANTLEQYQKEDYFQKNRIEIILEKSDFKMTDKYWIAARVIGFNRKKQPVLNEEAYHFISAQQAKMGELFEENGKKWILSPLSYFPDTKTMQEHQKKGYIMSIC